MRPCERNSNREKECEEIYRRKQPEQTGGSLARALYFQNKMRS